MSGSVDVEVARWLSEHRTDTLTAICRHLEDPGTSPLFFLVVGVVGAGVVTRLRLWRRVPRVLFAPYVAIILSGQLKQAFDRTRPSGDLALSALGGPSMPSSHAMFTASAVTAVLLASWWTSARVHRIATFVGAVGCVVSGAAMVYLGGHWLSDVLVGWVLGIGIAYAVMKVRPPRRRLQTV